MSRFSVFKYLAHTWRCQKIAERRSKFNEEIGHLDKARPWNNIVCGLVCEGDHRLKGPLQSVLPSLNGIFEEHLDLIFNSRQNISAPTAHIRDRRSMAYSAEISRTNPSCFLFVIDQSGSMSDSLPEGGRTKATGVSDAINKLLQELVIRCAKEEGVRDYFYVGVIGYGETVGAAFSGALSGKDIVPVSDIANSPARIEERNKKVEDGAGGLMDQKIRFPIWFDPVAAGGTPMCKALSQGKAILQDFISKHPNCFPPVAIHITDGESTDGEPSEAMRALTSLSSIDGNVMLFNLHLSSNPNARPTAFPNDSTSLPDQFSQSLFGGSSQLTSFMRAVAAEHGFNLTEGARGFVMNADLVLVIQALDIGTRPSNLR